MSKKFVYLLERKSRFNVDKNFLQFYPNFSFTHPQLRQKRILAFFIRKLILTQENNKLSIIILVYLLSIMKRDHSPVEEQLLDILESLLLKYPEGKYSCKKVVDSLVDDYGQRYKNFKASKTRSRMIIRWYTALLKDNSYGEAYYSLKNRIDQNLDEDYNTTLVFLVWKLSITNNFEILDKNFVTTRMRDFNSSEVYLINEYSKYLEENSRYQEALEFLEKFKFSDANDSLAVKKAYLRSLVKTKTNKILIEAKEVLSKDPFDKKHITLLFDNLEQTLEGQDIKQIFDIIFEILAVNGDKSWIWEKYHNFLRLFMKMDTFDDYVSKDKIEEFSKIHYNKLQLLKDAKEHLNIKKSSSIKKPNEERPSLKELNSLMQTKVQVLECLDISNDSTNEYINVFKKISSL